MLDLLLILAAAPAAAALDAPAPHPAVIVNPSWIRRPNPDELQAGWPVKGRGVKEARVTLKCRINVSGLTENCQVLNETPAGMDFGAAALQLTPNFLFRPRTIDGRPAPSEFVTTIHYVGGGARSAVGRVQVRTFARPPWVAAPTEAEVTAVLSAIPKARGGHAVLQCALKPNGRVSSCQPISASPDNGAAATQAAMKLTGRFDLDASSLPARELVATRVTIPFEFPQAGDPSPARITAPVWQSAPAAMVLPARLAASGVTDARATVVCRVEAGGALAACTAQAESPEGQGFGAAASAYAAQMRLTPWTQDGRPVDGATVAIPVHSRAAAPPAA